ncbi:MAG: SRPBCC family protein [Gemmatimonadota bacterium]|jgi:ligand-binding SRPBCC domain-containing protein
MNYRLERRQLVGGSLAEVFAFFEDPMNLEVITPPWLGFRVVAATDGEVRLGTRISYRLRLHGIPLRWTSVIAEYIPGEVFADEMLVGPYRRWYHRHRFRQVGDGVEIGDAVDYELPFGPLGRVAHAVMVRRALKRIFDHREREIARLFPYGPGAPGTD